MDNNLVSNELCKSDFEIFISEEELEEICKKVGKQIVDDYKYKSQKLYVIGILKGSCIFMSDLIRNINLPMEIDFISVSSYGGNTTSSGEVKMIKDLDWSIEGKDVLIVEDIIDTGLTLDFLKRSLIARRPKSLKVCALLDKPSRRKIDIEGDYIGKKIEDKFVIGYGLDFNGRYRNLPFISIFKP